MEIFWANWRKSPDPEPVSTRPDARGFDADFVVLREQIHDDTHENSCIILILGQRGIDDFTPLDWPCETVHKSSYGA